MKKSLLVTLIVSCTLLFAGCPKAEKSAGMALDNAGDVVEHGSEKLWIEPGEEAEIVD